jgi:hypothetical protein
VREALKIGAETYKGEMEMDYLSRLSPIKITPNARMHRAITAWVYVSSVTRGWKHDEAILA